MTRRLLDDDEVARQLDQLPRWSGDTATLHRTYGFATFADLVAAFNDIAQAAQDADHHPDLDIRWTTLHVACWTHDRGGVTQLDIELAHRIEEIARMHGAR